MERVNGNLRSKKSELNSFETVLGCVKHLMVEIDDDSENEALHESLRQVRLHLPTVANEVKRIVHPSS